VRFLDDKGRLLGRLNIIDAAVLLAALLAGVTAYQVLTAGHRVAPPFALEENSGWRLVEIWMPPSDAFLAEDLQRGAWQPDPRSGEPIARIEGWEVVAGRGLRVDVALWCQVDSEGRVLYRSRQLLPGRELEIETEVCVVLGKVVSVGEASAR